MRPNWSLKRSAYGARLARTLGVAKLDADLMLLEACLEMGCPRELAQVLYEGVRLFGYAAYDEDQRAAGIAAGSSHVTG